MTPYSENFDPFRAQYLNGVDYVYDVNPYDRDDYIPNDLDEGPEFDFEHTDYGSDGEHSDVDVEPNNYDKESFFAPLSVSSLYNDYEGVDPLRKFVDKITDQIEINEILSLTPTELNARGNTRTLSHKFSTNLGIIITDPEISWEVHFKHAMRRKAENLEPAPFFRVSVKNFITIRRLRFNLIERIRKDVFIEQYELYQDNVLIAAKYKDRSFEVLCPNLYEECMKIPTESEIYRHFFFLFRTKQNFDTHNAPHLWQARSVSNANSQETNVAIVPYKKELYEQEVTILDDLTQNEFWRAELLLLKALVLKQETNLFDAEAPWQQNFCVSVLMGKDKSGTNTVLEYLRGNVSINEIGLTKQNAERFLKIVKCLDIAIKINNTRRAGQKLWFPNSCYELRTRILQLGSPQMKSYEAYTMTLHEGRMKDENYWLNENNWCTERIGLYVKILAQHFIRSRTLSNGLKFIRVITGGTAVGKSTIAPKGTWNPDEFKFFLKQNTKGIINSQIHEEGSTFFKRILKKALETPGFTPDKQLAQLNFVLDKRMKKVQDLEEIVAAAKSRGVSVEINDLDGPLTTSLIRVLTRDPFGRDPCPTVEGIKEGYVEIRKSRLAINKKIEDEDVITNYQLLCFAKEEGSVKYKQKEVAKKENGKFVIIDRDLYKKLTQEPSTNEVEMELSTVITPEFIEEAVLRGDIREEDQGKIQQWLGLTLGEAVKLHALGVISL